MIEVLGIGLPGGDRKWLLRSVCARFETGSLTAVTSDRREERRALLEAIAGRRIPVEGRVWVGGVPVMPGSASRVWRLCAEVDPEAPVRPVRSVLSNALVPVIGTRVFTRLLRLPRRRVRESMMAALEQVGLGERANEPAVRLSALDRLRLQLARALSRRPRYLVVHDLDSALASAEVLAFLALLRGIIRRNRLGVIVSVAEAAAARPLADRVLVLRDRGVAHDPGPEASSSPHRSERTGSLTR